MNAFRVRRRAVLLWFRSILKSGYLLVEVGKFMNVHAVLVALNPFQLCDLQLLNLFLSITQDHARACLARNDDAALDFQRVDYGHLKLNRILC